MHNDVFLKLRREVLEVVGPTERPSFDHIKDMKYLRAVLNGRALGDRFTRGKRHLTCTHVLETLRLFPAVPMNVKESVESRAWTDPVTGERWYIPAGTKCVVPFLSPCLCLRMSDLSLWLIESHGVS